MLKTILGEKIEQSQSFDQNGRRIPVTRIKAGPCFIIQIKKAENDGYWAIQLGFGEKKIKNTAKPILGHLKKAGLKTPLRFFKEIRLPVSPPLADNQNLKPGNLLKVNDIFKIGDSVNITGTSKGKGFAGVIKKWGFSTGPRTHGQSDRYRAPGSIGQTTTPGRVYKGKKMAGRMGNEKVTVKNLKVMDIDEKNHILTVKGLVPGAKKGLLIISK